MKIHKIYDTIIIDLSIPKNSTQLYFSDYAELYIKKQLIGAGFDLRKTIYREYDIVEQCLVYIQED